MEQEGANIYKTIMASQHGLYNACESKNDTFNLKKYKKSELIIK